MWGPETVGGGGRQRCKGGKSKFTYRVLTGTLHILQILFPWNKSKTLVLDSISQISELISSFQKTEEWEKDKTEADMEEYVWNNSSSEKNILETLLQMKAAEKNLEVNKEELLGTKEVEEYKKSVVSLKNEGDNENTLSRYKESVKKLLNLMWFI